MYCIRVNSRIWYVHLPDEYFLYTTVWVEAIDELVHDLPRAERALAAFLARASALDQTCIDILHSGFALIEVRAHRPCTLS